MKSTVPSFFFLSVFIIVINKNITHRYKALLDQYRELPKEVNRGIYTRRILDIVKNVKKQKAEIDKGTTVPLRFVLPLRNLTQYNITQCCLI